MDVEIAFLIEISRVAGVQPAIDDGRRGGAIITPIALGHHRPAHHNLPNAAGRTGLAIGIDDAHLHPRQRTAAGFEFAARGHMIIRCQHDNGAGRFGHAVSLRKAATEDTAGFDHHPFRNRRTAIGNEFQMREIEFFDSRHLQTHLDHGRCQCGAGDLFPRKGRHRIRRAELIDGDEAGAGMDAAQHRIDAVDVKERRRREHGVFRRGVLPRHMGEDVDIRSVVVIGELYALGQAGGAAGIHLHDDIGRIVGEVRHLCRIRIAPGGIPALAHHHHGARARGSTHSGEKFVFHEQEFGFAVIEDVADFGRGQPPVHRQKNRARLQRAHQNFHEGIGIARHDADTGTGAATRRDQPLCHAIGARLKLGIGELTVFKLNGNGVRADAGLKRCPFREDGAFNRHGRFRYSQDFKLFAGQRFASAGPGARSTVRKPRWLAARSASCGSRAPER